MGDEEEAMTVICRMASDVLSYQDEGIQMQGMELLRVNVADKFMQKMNL